MYQSLVQLITEKMLILNHKLQVLFWAFSFSLYFSKIICL